MTERKYTNANKNQLLINKKTIICNLYELSIRDAEWQHNKLEEALITKINATCLCPSPVPLIINSLIEVMLISNKLLPISTTFICRVFLSLIQPRKYLLSSLHKVLKNLELTFSSSFLEILKNLL